MQKIRTARFWSGCALIVFCSLFLSVPVASSLSLPLAYRVPVVLKNSVGNPITTAQDIRISLWGRGVFKAQDITGLGTLNTLLPYYGGYQTTFTITPDASGYFVPVSYGLYNILPEFLAGFPNDITPNNAYLQLDYKSSGDPDTSYAVYDFGSEGGNVERYILDLSLLEQELNAGQGTDASFFILDAADSSEDYIKLQFGEVLAEYISWNIANVSFEMSGANLVLNADNIGSGMDVSIIANQGADNDGILRYSAANNRWEMSNDGGGFVSFSGWFGSEDRIKLVPSDFVSDDADDNLTINASGTHVTASSGTVDAGLTIALPSGYRATHVMIYGSDVFNGVSVFTNDISSTSSTSLGTGLVGTEIDITDMVSTATNYLSVFVNLGSSDQIFGGYITIAPIP